MSLRTDIKGKRVLLLGACGVLGRRHADILAEQGASLALADRPGSDVLALAKSLGARGVEIDVTDEPGLIAGVAAAEAALGGIDGAIPGAPAAGQAIEEGSQGEVRAPHDEGLHESNLSCQPRLGSRG